MTTRAKRVRINDNTRQVNQYARPTAADVTCVSERSIRSGELAIVYAGGGRDGVLTGRSRYGRVSIMNPDQTGLVATAFNDRYLSTAPDSARPEQGKTALGVLVTTPSYEAAQKKRRNGGTSSGKEQSQPDAVVAMTGLVTVTVDVDKGTYLSTVPAVKTHIREKCLEGLVIDEPRRGSGTVLMYDQLRSAFARGSSSMCCRGYPFQFSIDPTKRRPSEAEAFTQPRGRAKRHIQYNSPNPFDVNMKVVANSHIEIGDLVVASIEGRALESNDLMLEVKSITEVYKREEVIVIGVAVATSERPKQNAANKESAVPLGGANKTRRRYVPVRVGGTVSINDTWKYLQFTDPATSLPPVPASRRPLRHLRSGVRYIQASESSVGGVGAIVKGGRFDVDGAKLLKYRLQVFIQPLQVHTQAGFHARIGHMSW